MGTREPTLFNRKPGWLFGVGGVRMRMGKRRERKWPLTTVQISIEVGHLEQEGYEGRTQADRQRKRREDQERREDSEEVMVGNKEEPGCRS